MENNVQAHWCIITEESWLMRLSAELMWLHISELWERIKRLPCQIAAALFVFDIPLWKLSWWSRKTNKHWSFFAFWALVSSCWKLALCPQRAKRGFWKWTGPDWDFHYVLMLDHLSNCNISPRQICPFMLCELKVGLFHCLTKKVILWAVLVKCVIQKWAITYTNMTQSSFWPKAPYFPASLKEVIFTW